MERPNALSLALAAARDALAGLGPGANVEGDQSA
jgi:hypothetical protein